MISREDEQKSIERMESAFRARMDALTRMNNQFYPNGNGIITDDVLNEFEAAEAEFISANEEMNVITEQIRNGNRK